MVSFMPWFMRFDDDHLHDEQDDGKSFMPQESSETNWYRGKSYVVHGTILYYETIDNVLWSCERFDAETQQL
jgi:hypothetical protein